MIYIAYGTTTLVAALVAGKLEPKGSRPILQFSVSQPQASLRTNVSLNVIHTWRLRIGSAASSMASGIAPSIIPGAGSQMGQESKVTENRLRRIAARRGYRLEKSRRRDKNAIDYGGFMLVDAYKNTVVLGATSFAYSSTLDEIESFLNSRASP